jgi:hypothetical protein
VESLTTSLMTDRLEIRPVTWDAIQAINGGRRLEQWASDFPDAGDVAIARLLGQLESHH